MPDDQRERMQPKGPERNYVPMIIAMIAVIVFAAIWAITTLVLT